MTATVATDVLTAEEVMALVGCSRRKLYDLAGRDLPGFKVGRQWRFLRRDVDDFIARRKRLAAQRPKGKRGPRRRT